MCENCNGELIHTETFTTTEGTVWEYGIFSVGTHEVRRRLVGEEHFQPIEKEDLAEMSVHHIEFYEALKIPF